MQIPANEALVPLYYDDVFLGAYPKKRIRKLFIEQGKKAQKYIETFGTEQLKACYYGRIDFNRNGTMKKAQLTLSRIADDNSLDKIVTHEPETSYFGVVYAK